ncbi:MAG TPA: hypothetical protein VFA46_04820 [Actinomycetes bacterium]|jgi:ribosomal protein S27AE|nr:hypothetical protein [Actinomycetes bacterium]
MSIGTQQRGGTALTLRREVCDKCGNQMVLGSGHQFERWQCPWCHQVVGIDRDPKIAARFQLRRGYTWRYSPDALHT